MADSELKPHPNLIVQSPPPSSARAEFNRAEVVATLLAAKVVIDGVLKVVPVTLLP
jgi:hypothetical protein